MDALALEREGQGDPLVLLHGVGTSRVIWRRVLPALARDREAVAVDMPGFGESPPAGSGFELDAVADALADGLGRAGIARFDLVGHSLGGAVALSLAARRPDAVRRLMLVAPAGFRALPGWLTGGGSAVAAGFVAARRKVGLPLLGDGVARRLPLVGGGLTRRLLLAGAVHDGSRLAPDDARTMLAASRGARRMRAAMASAGSADLRPALAALRAPLGLIWGERDRVVPVAGLELIRELRTGTRAVTIPDAGHVVQIEQPEAFTRAVLRLLEVTDS